MPVNPINKSAVLTEPSPQVSAHLKQNTGVRGQTKPISKNSYEILSKRFEKVEKRQKQNQNQNYKMGFVILRAALDRVVATKLADLTESYSDELESIKKYIQAERATCIENTPSPEYEGRVENSREIAQRFERAKNKIEQVYQELKSESEKVAKSYSESLVNKIPNDPTSVDQSLRKYGITCEVLPFQNNTYDIGRVTVELTLLPLLKGNDVYYKQTNTLKWLTVQKCIHDNSSDVTTSATNKVNKSYINMLYQVWPMVGRAVFSDHAGFVAEYKNEGSKPVYVYYQSLEHGHTHTNTRVTSNYGSLPSLNLISNFKKDIVRKISDHREKFIIALCDELDELINLGANSKADILVIVGECTLDIHNEILSRVCGYSNVYSKGYPGRIYNEIDGSNALYFTKYKNYRLKYINASKEGLGVNAFSAYLFEYADDFQHISTPRTKVTADMVTLIGSDVKQNIITLTHSNGDAKHAFAHLLNGRENEIASELENAGYISVAGDLNNINAGEKWVELYETVNRKKTNISMGSNSTSSKMYDKVVLLTGGWK